MGSGHPEFGHYSNRERAVRLPPSVLFQERYCLGMGTVMLNGFTFETGTCVLYLFQGWVLNTKGKYAGACVGTFFAAMASQVCV